MLPLIGLGVGLLGGIGKMFGRGKANRELKKLEKMNPQYAENPLAAQRLGLMNQLYRGRMAGAGALERNIFSNQSNTIGNVARNATDASQLLSMVAGAQGQTNQSLSNLQTAETMDAQRRLQNLVGAQQGLIQEKDKVFQDQVRRYGDTLAIRGAQQQNRQANWGDLSNLGFQVMDFGMAGGMQQFKKKNGGSSGGGGTAGYGADFDNYGMNWGNG